MFQLVADSVSSTGRRAAELQHIEVATVEAHSSLPEDDAGTVHDPIDDGGNGEQRGQDGQGKCRDTCVDEPFDPPERVPKVVIPEPDQVGCRRRGRSGPGWASPRIAGHHGDRYRQLLDVADGIDQLPGGLVTVSEEQVFGR